MSWRAAGASYRFPQKSRALLADRNVEMLEKRLGLPVLGMMPATGANAEPSGKNKKRKSGKGSHSSGQKGGARR